MFGEDAPHDAFVDRQSFFTVSSNLSNAVKARERWGARRQDLAVSESARAVRFQYRWTRYRSLMYVTTVPTGVSSALSV